MRVRNARRLPPAKQFWYMLRHAQRLSVRGDASFHLAKLIVRDAMLQAIGNLGGELERIYDTALSMERAA